jgi:hypothetical protein
MYGRSLVLGLCALCFVASGCGTSDEDKATRVAEQFQRALLDPAGHPCRLLEPALVKAEGGAACDRRLRAKHRRRVGKAKVRVDQVFEDSGITRASIHIGRTGLELNDSLGKWSIDSVARFARDFSVSRTQVRPVEWQRARVDRRARRLSLTYLSGGPTVLPSRITIERAGDRLLATPFELVRRPEALPQSIACASARLPRRWLGLTIVQGTTGRPPPPKSVRYMKRLFGNKQPPCRPVPAVHRR